MKKLLFNPFEKYDGRPILTIGLLVTVLGSFLGYLFNARFDGAIDMHFVEDVTYAEPFTDNVFNIAVLFLSLYVFGYIINKKTRPVDILGIVMLARLPLYFDTLTNINGFMYSFGEKLLKAGPDYTKIDPMDIAVPALIGLLTIPLLIWYIALLYNGVKTATNLKTTQHKVWFGITLVIAEILSKLVFFLIYG